MVHQFQLLEFISGAWQKSKQTAFQSKIHRKEMREENDMQYVDLEKMLSNRFFYL